ncbi:MAG TPA: Hsp20/alpha crystallin family protein [Candidatus Binatia bacterium]|nr:Hsp20/alpha crystallin family protein [Candidatus Binatia bacterium]
MAKKQNGLVSFPIHVSAEIERLFDDLIHRPWGFCREARGWNPSVDLYENGNCFLLEADLPGVKLEDITVEVENGDLVLRGYRAIVQTRSEGRFREMERSSGHFLRRLKLPESVEASQIKAEFCDGVLRVTIPKVKNIKEQSHD